MKTYEWRPGVWGVNEHIGLYAGSLSPVVAQAVVTESGRCYLRKRSPNGYHHALYPVNELNDARPPFTLDEKKAALEMLVRLGEGS